MKRKYIKPEIIKETAIDMDYYLLASSIVSNIEGVEIEGQQSGGFFDIDAGSTFNHEWGQ